MKPLQQVDRTCVRWGQRKLIYFGGCDYFRLASDPRVRRALCAALKQYGLNVAASRVTTGHHLLYEKLEGALAAFFSAPAALLLPNGYSTNLAAAQALEGTISLAVIDAEAHPSLADAVRLLGCPAMTFKHRDVQDLASMTARQRANSRLLLATDGMFSRSGAPAPLRAYAEVLPKDALILVDDAHAAGVHGKTGKGSIEREGISRRRVVQTITLSKAFGVHGGAILCSRSLRNQVIKQSGVFIGSTPLPLPLAAAALEALRIMRSGSGLRLRLLANICYFHWRMGNEAFGNVEACNPIVALEPKSRNHAAELRQRLLAAGIHPPLIHYGVHPAKPLFRFALSSEHSHEQLDRLAQVLRQCGRALVPVQA